MRRVVVRIIAMAALLVPLPASATHQGATPSSPSIAYEPPYAAATATGWDKLEAECARQADLSGALRPDAAAGRIDAAAGVEIDDCARYSSGLRRDWRIGAVPAEMAGWPGTVVLVVETEGGHADRDGAIAGSATLALKLGDRSWSLARISCDLTCESVTPARGTQTFEAHLDSLPDELLVSLSSETSAGPGTGALAAEFRGSLVRVVLLPAAAA